MTKDQLDHNINLIEDLISRIPRDSREFSLAITKLEESVMWLLKARKAL